MKNKCRNTEKFCPNKRHLLSFADAIPVPACRSLIFQTATALLPVTEFAPPFSCSARSVYTIILNFGASWPDVNEKWTETYDVAYSFGPSVIFNRRYLNKNRPLLQLIGLKNKAPV